VLCHLLCQLSKPETRGEIFCNKECFKVHDPVKILNQNSVRGMFTGGMLQMELEFISILYQEILNLFATGILL
jgi:hypothetical protein